jgi:DNA-binding SARP family transcriptional activator
VLRLRNNLEPGRNGTPSVVVTEGAGYRLAVPPESVDAESFSRLVGLGRGALSADQPAAASATLRQAIEMWRGPAYAGIDAPVVRAAARRLEELRMAAVEDWLTAELDVGRADAVVAELEPLVTASLYRERLWYLLVLALYRADRQGDALAAYSRARHVLSQDVGVEPGPELRALHARVLDQDPTLAGRRCMCATSSRRRVAEARRRPRRVGRGTDKAHSDSSVVLVVAARLGRPARHGLREAGCRDDDAPVPAIGADDLHIPLALGHVRTAAGERDLVALG